MSNKSTLCLACLVTPLCLHGVTMAGRTTALSALHLPPVSVQRTVAKISVPIKTFTRVEVTLRSRASENEPAEEKTLRRSVGGRQLEKVTGEYEDRKHQTSHENKMWKITSPKRNPLQASSGYFPVAETVFSISTGVQEGWIYVLYRWRAPIFSTRSRQGARTTQRPHYVQCWPIDFLGRNQTQSLMRYVLNHYLLFEMFWVLAIYTCAYEFMVAKLDSTVA